MVYSAYTDTLFPFEFLFSRFNRPFQEIKSGIYVEKKDETGGTVYLNIFGISPDDVDITWKNGQRNDTVEFTVKGETKIDELRPFNIEYKFVVPHTVKTMKKRFLNGLLALDFTFNKPAQPDIEVLEN